MSDSLKHKVCRSAFPKGLSALSWEQKSAQKHYLPLYSEFLVDIVLVYSKELKFCIVSLYVYPSNVHTDELIHNV